MGRKRIPWDRASLQGDLELLSVHCESRADAGKGLCPGIFHPLVLQHGAMRRAYGYRQTETPSKSNEPQREDLSKVFPDTVK